MQVRRIMRRHEPVPGGMQMSATVRAVQVLEPGAPYTVVQVPKREPGLAQVRVTVEACGVCHSDSMITSGHLPGVEFPVTTGHEIAGRIDAIGQGVDGFSVGDRVAIGWYGGGDGTCEACREGDGVNCPELKIPGVAYAGGYADSVVVPAVALARIPDELTAVEAAPLACAGVTTFNALRRSAARPGDLVAILGLGGLGHLGVQFAAAMGFETVAIARGAEKKELAVPNGEAMAATIDGLSRRGELIIAGATPDALPVSGLQLLTGSKKIYGHASGVALDTEHTLQFAAQTGVRAWVEEAKLEDADAAVQKMLSGEARFRMVLTTGN
jgi:D-arabinose 1-dehydrogenase-like Zn-dependent alcohol dehydrogenase